MSVKQISIFLENRSGRLADVTKVIGENGIDISALSIADTTDFGILRMIVNNPEKAAEVLKQNGYAASVSDVLAIAIDDAPGSLSNTLCALADGGIEVEYIYAFIGKKDPRALVVLKAKNIEGAVSVLEATGVDVLSDEEVYKL